MYHASPVERWAFFLVNAEHLSEADVGRLFPDEEIAEAAGVLSMIHQTPEARMRYDARLKFQRDEESRLRRAKQEGLAEGIERGIEQGIERGHLCGRISVLQQLLGLPESTVEQFTELTVLQLRELECTLQQQLRELLGLHGRK